MKAGIYIHIPFCRSRCSYCDFATDVYKNEETVERYVSALCREIENFSQLQTFDSQFVETIYFGGGTPSLLTAKQLGKILSAIHKKFFVDENSEITMEMNPATVTLETLQAYKNLGINRASFGAQTFDDTELKRLGRKHTANDVRETIDLLRTADFDNVSFDLIAGLPRQMLTDWERNLDEALKLKPEHLSLYLLEIHEETPLAEQIRSGRQPLPDEDLAGEMYELMVETVSAKGFQQYEISNFSLPNFASRHNSKYWLCEPVYAFGVSAHSFDGQKKRWANERDTLKYVRRIEKENSAIVEQTEINLKSEFVFLGLRLAKGIDVDEYKKRFGADLRVEYAEDLKRLKEAGLIEFSRNRLKLTKKGFLFSNEVFAVFV
ncbi:MAG: radical SAM family heme chaperone HemW [Acidobacteriota bacterium]|nr:radical SAM family heme chaperone HemW [Acidobacteriota bacterium]